MNDLPDSDKFREQLNLMICGYTGSQKEGGKILTCIG